MAAQNATPEDYGLRVRSHPDGLLITARTKMRDSAELRLSFSGYCAQTTLFLRNREMQIANASLVERFLSQQSVFGRLLDQGDARKGAHLWRGVPGAEVARFLEEFQVSSKAYRVNGSLMARYIHACMSLGQATSLDNRAPVDPKQGARASLRRSSTRPSPT